MTDTYVRKQHTGEPTRNGGEFGHSRNDEAAGVTLALPTSTGPTQKHISLAAEHQVHFPDTQGGDPKYWWRRDRVKAVLHGAEPDGLTTEEAMGWRTVDRNIIPMVNEWMTNQPLSWIAYQLERQEQASRGQADGRAPERERTAWTVRADRLRQIATQVRAIADEELDEARARNAAPTLEESIAAQRQAAIEQVIADRDRRETAAAKRSATPSAPVFDEVNRRRRGQKFFTAELKKWPKIGTHKNTPVDEIPISGHFFAGSFDFWAAEYDPQTGEAWGYTRIHGSGNDGEWGYTDMRDLEKQLIGPYQQPIERETSWSKKPFSAVER